MSDNEYEYDSEFEHEHEEESEEQLIDKINKARLETRQLYEQIDKMKQKVHDTTLVECSKQLTSIAQNTNDNSSVNLKPLQILKGHNNKIADLKWSQDSKSILSCSQDGFLIIWDPTTGLKLNAIPMDSDWVLSCGYSPNGKLVASAGLNNNCTIYSVPTDPTYEFEQRPVTVFKGHVCGITGVEFFDNEKVVTASGDMTCALWDVTKGKRVTQYLDHFGDVLALDINRGKNIFASGASDGYLRVWDIRSSEGSAERSFFVSNSDVTSTKFFEDGNCLVTGSDDGIIRMIDLRMDGELNQYSLNDFGYSHKQQTFFNEQPPSTQSPVYSTGFENFQLSQQYSISDMSSTLDASGVTSLDFSASGRLMYACYSEHGCIIWDTLKGEVAGKLEGHSNRVVRVAASPNGFGVVTGSWDTTMRVYTPSYV